jgi:hypothetical protein
MSAADLAVAEPRSREFRGALDRLVNGLLFITLLASPLVFIEPSPYEAAFAVLALAAVVAGLRIDRTVLTLTVLLLLYNVGGLLSLTLALHDDKAVTFIVTSFFMAATSVLFAAMLLDDTERRAEIFGNAYVAAAILCALVGMAMHFRIIPPLDATADRLRSTFKDPNVFGPFLILPLLFLIDTIMRRGASFLRIAGATILLVALFLSYSRGAWAHFMVSAVVLFMLMFLTADTTRFRLRIVGFSIVAVVAVAALIAGLLSFDAVGAMFEERASIVQDYDAGSGGRFDRQLLAITTILENPLGLGPMQFALRFRLDPHNVYLSAFLSYSWLGGFAYLALILATLALGFRCLRIATPWQPVLIAAYAAFVGVALEGFVIDTDHWRHFFLFLGIIWGLSAASLRLRRQ